MIIKLSSTDALAVIGDLKKLIPQWDQARMSPVNGVAFIRLPDEIVAEAAYNDEGDLIAPATYAGEIRFDVVWPDEVKLPELNTRVLPETSDHKIY